MLLVHPSKPSYPKNCTTEEQKQQYVDEYMAIEGIQFDREKIEHNPGMRALSKLMLNSFWGMYFLRRRGKRIFYRHLQ